MVAQNKSLKTMVCVTRQVCTTNARTIKLTLLTSGSHEDSMIAALQGHQFESAELLL